MQHKRNLDVRDIPILREDPPITSYSELLSPAAIHIRLSNTCNLACPACELINQATGEKDVEGDMSLETWERVRDTAMPYVKGVEIVGLGEPTLSPLFPGICKDVLDANKILYVCTNGTTLGSKKILDALGDSPRVSVSLDACDAESYAKVRGGDEATWNKVIANIKKFRKAKPNAWLHSQFTAGSYNIEYFPAFVQLVKDIGFDEVQFRFVQNHATAREDVSLRFAQDLTERKIYEAQLIAEQPGGQLKNLKVERRPYSQYASNSLGDSSPASRLKRYLDFVPLGDSSTCTAPCSCWYMGSNFTQTSGFYTTGSTTSNSYSSVYWNSGGGTCVCGSCTTFSNWAVTYNSQTLNLYGGEIWYTSTSINNNNVVCVSTTCSTIAGTSSTTTIICSTCTSYSNIEVLAWSEYFMESGTTSPNSGITSTFVLCGTTYTNAVGTCTSTTNICVSTTQIFTCPGTAELGQSDGTTSYESWVCNGTCSTDYHVTISAGSTLANNLVGAWCDGTSETIVGATEPQASPTLGVIRGKIVPRGTQTITETTDEKPVVFTWDATAIIFADGEICTCFAKHKIANVLDEGFEWNRDVIGSARYQAFLHNRRDGRLNAASEPTCGNCPNMC